MIDEAELMRALHAELTPILAVKVTDRRPYGMAEDSVQTWAISDVRRVVNQLARSVPSRPAPDDSELPGMWSASDFTGGAEWFNCGVCGKNVLSPHRCPASRPALDRE